MGNVATRGGCY